MTHVEKPFVNFFYVWPRRLNVEGRTMFDSTTFALLP